MTDTEALLDEPSTPLILDDGKPLWRQIGELFLKHGDPTPSWRLRDELVNHLDWARYAKYLARQAKKLEAERDEARRERSTAEEFSAHKIDALIAGNRRIEELESELAALRKQEPVAWQYRYLYAPDGLLGGDWGGWGNKRYDYPENTGLLEEQKRPLFASPVKTSGALVNALKRIAKMSSDCRACEGAGAIARAVLRQECKP